MTSGAASEAAIEVTGLTKRYGERAVVRDLSFRVQPGEIVALLGPNGAGKTTTVEIIEGYRAPDGGSVAVLGADPRRAGRDWRARVGLMLQGGGGIDPRLTPREVLGLYAAFHADPAQPDELLRTVGLDDPRIARTRYRRLSGGERQRLGLALALVGHPALAILDEPTAGMDVEARAATRDLLARLRLEGMTILLTSHDLADVERIADRIAIIDRGRLRAFGRIDELVAESGALVRLRLSSPVTDSDLADLRGALGDGGNGVAVDADGGAGRYRVSGVTPSPALVARLAAWCDARGLLLVELRTGGGTLEERYLELTGSDADGDEDEPSSTRGSVAAGGAEAGR
jgi:ABC-2 type transport system ATP-binding protein